MKKKEGKFGYYKKNNPAFNIEDSGNYPPEFNDDLKEEIRDREYHICPICRKPEYVEIYELGRLLSIHHIDYIKVNCSKNNLIALCCSCHSTTNVGNRWFWTQYFNELYIRRFGLPKPEEQLMLEYKPLSK